MTDEKVEGEGEGCRACFADQVAAQGEAIANGETPKPLCQVAARIAAQLDASREALHESPFKPVSLEIGGKFTG